MAYGSVKVDTIIFDNGGSDQNVTASGIYRAITSGVTVAGTLAGNTISGVTVIGSTLVSGVTILGSTLVSGAVVQGTTGTFTTLTGTTTTGTTADFVSGVFTTQISGASVTGTTANFVSGNFTTLSGINATFTSSVIGPTAAVDTNTTALATTAYVIAQNYTKQTRAISVGSGLTGGGDLTADRTIAADFASQVEAEAGTNSTKVMTPERTAQALLKLPGYAITVTAISKTMANRERCTVTTSGCTITLPPTPAAGEEVTITIAGTFTDTIISRNGSNVMNRAENLTIDKADVSVTLYYVDATRGWRII